MEPPADRIGLWLRRDLLATTERLAQSRSMGSTARTAARQVARGRADRSFIRCRRFLVGTSCWGGRKTGPSPTDRSRPGSKHHILVDANGVPISAILTGANRNDVTQLLPLVDAIPPIRGARGRPLQKPKVIYADRGYDSDPHRQRLRERGIKPVIARRRTEHGSGLGKFRWVVERTHSWLHNFRRLRIRFDRRAGRVENWRAHVRLRWQFRCFRKGPQSGCHSHVSSSRHVERSGPFSGTTLSCLLHVNVYGTYHAADAFDAVW